MLSAPVASLRGVGEARAAALEKKGIHTIADLLYFLPREYQDFSSSTQVAQAEHGALCALRLCVAQEPKLLFPSRGLQMVTAPAQDGSGRIQLVWFNQPYRKNQIKAGDQKIFCGRVDKSRGVRLVNPFVQDSLPGILPVYPFMQGVGQAQLRSMLKQALTGVQGKLQESMPQPFRSTYGLCGIEEALRHIHFPPSQDALKEAKYRLSFEDMLYYLLAIGLLKQERSGRKGVAFQVGGLCEQFLKKLEFQPTGAQLRVLSEIQADMALPAPMNRLVQGDVGSGKTILAFYAMDIAAQNGYQSVLMAPTEILARQHYDRLFAMYGEQVCFLQGGMKKKERDSAYARIANGEAKRIVGTHALLQSGLSFHKLGLVVADEQHRFGVRQRAQIANKAAHTPDMLIMSATPIPRTLAMLLYGDLSLSVLDELPPGRRPVITRVVREEKRTDMYGFILQQVQSGRQAYVVCPFVEQSEVLDDVRSAQQAYEELTAQLSSARIALLHGRMAAAKKEEAIEAFRTGKLDILVSTTVVEVGVDVPNATIMVIESADRFGLAQLHQLRGRVGRGANQSFCFLLSGSAGENAAARMDIMVKSSDGFLIAQKDLEIRGPGDFLGTRQHGEDGLYAAKMAASMEVLLHAQLAADALQAQGESHENEVIFARAREIYYKRMRDIAQN